MSIAEYRSKRPVHTKWDELRIALCQREGKRIKSNSKISSFIISKSQKSLFASFWKRRLQFYSPALRIRRIYIAPWRFRNFKQNGIWRWASADWFPAVVKPFLGAWAESSTGHRSRNNKNNREPELVEKFIDTSSIFWKTTKWKWSSTRFRILLKMRLLSMIGKFAYGALILRKGENKSHSWTRIFSNF